MLHSQDRAGAFNPFLLKSSSNKSCLHPQYFDGNYYVIENDITDNLRAFARNDLKNISPLNIFPAALMSQFTRFALVFAVTRINW